MDPSLDRERATMVVAGLSPSEKVGWCFGSSVWAATVICLYCRQSKGLRETWALDAQHLLESQNCLVGFAVIAERPVRDAEGAGVPVG